MDIVGHCQVSGIAYYYDKRLGTIIPDSIRPEYFSKIPIEQAEPVSSILQIERLHNEFQVVIIDKNDSMASVTVLYRDTNKTFECSKYDPAKIIKSILQDKELELYFIARDHPHHKKDPTSYYELNTREGPTYVNSAVTGPITYNSAVTGPITYNTVTPNSVTYNTVTPNSVTYNSATTGYLASMPHYRPEQHHRPTQHYKPHDNPYSRPQNKSHTANGCYAPIDIDNTEDSYLYETNRNYGIDTSARNTDEKIERVVDLHMPEIKYEPPYRVGMPPDIAWHAVSSRIQEPNSNSDDSGCDSCGSDIVWADAEPNTTITDEDMKEIEATFGPGNSRVYHGLSNNGIHGSHLQNSPLTHCSSGTLTFDKLDSFSNDCERIPASSGLNRMGKPLKKIMHYSNSNSTDTDVYLYEKLAAAHRARKEAEAEIAYQTAINESILDYDSKLNQEIHAACDKIQHINMVELSLGITENTREPVLSEVLKLSNVPDEPVVSITDIPKLEERGDNL